MASTVNIQSAFGAVTVAMAVSVAVCWVTARRPVSPLRGFLGVEDDADEEADYGATGCEEDAVVFDFYPEDEGDYVVCSNRKKALLAVVEATRDMSGGNGDGARDQVRANIRVKSFRSPNDFKSCQREPNQYKHFSSSLLEIKME
jgi:hypothetical protein